MRRSATLLLLSAGLGLGYVGLSAEIIHLKNGRTIWAEHVRENGAQVEYEIGDDSYSIPKSLVERVEAGGISPQAGGSASTGSRDLPVFAPAVKANQDSPALKKIVHDGQVDEGELSSLEQSGDAATAAAAYFLAGKYEFDRGNFSRARSFLDNALRFDADNPSALNYYAVLLAKTGHASEALPYAERAVRSSPNSPDSLTVLGFVQYAADRDQEAIRTWKRSLELRPDPAVQSYLAKAERDATVQAGYSERESTHFTLHYEGEQTSESLRSQLLATLDSEYDDLVRELGIEPRSSIGVVLYTKQTFFDVTQAPSWSGAINDGKLRIPVQGVTSITPELARVLKHELAHSFINQLSVGRCPQWLNEGIAQLVEPKLLTNGSRLAELYRSQRQIPLNAMEGTFVNFSTAQATLAYAESLAVTQYITETYGMSDLQRVLQKLGEGSSTEAALRVILHSSYADLENELAKYLESKYGS
ncbi:MAG TPA: peptidase MA family metallohydrolase [Terriglobales bacterium]|nr:peptidase MA family metallohydrolase [Terriglobales bacterium]